MKNEIDDILNSMFGRSASTGRSKAAEDAEAFLKSISEGGKGITKSLNQQIENLNEVNDAAQSDLAEVAKRLEEDGLKETAEEHKAATGSELAKADINEAFVKAEESAKSQVIGQDDFLHKLFLAFKRPLVMGTEEGKPATAIVITGKTGTGRHSALNCVVENLAAGGVLKSPKTMLVDLALYSGSGDGKLFIQDLFAAIESKIPVILFENYDKCHKSLLTMLTDLVLTGKLQLNSRYANQKGMLIDVGTALVPGAISSISCAGRYLVFLTTNNQGRIADSMGAAFMNGLGDICMTQSFTPESLTAIGKKELMELWEKTEKVLEFEVDCEDAVSGYFAGKFTVSDGVNAIADYAQRCYKALSEYKLSSSTEKAQCKAMLNGDILEFRFGEAVIPVEHITEDSAAVEEVKAQMQEIVGLKTVKDYIFSLEENYKVQQLRRQKGMKADPPSMHMIFTGNPGTGKTTIARLVSRYLKAMGVLTGGQLIEVTRADLVGRFVGHTAPLTRQVIESAIGGVLFVDEAYSLYRGNDDTFGLEAIDTLVKGMEDNRDNLLVILAGYSKEMEEFLKSNSGLVSRFPNVIEFPDYTAQELLEITKITVRNKGYKLLEECDASLLSHYEKRQAENSRTAGNGRMVRNLVENAILNQSKRIVAEKSDNYEDLTLCDFEL